MIYLCASDTGSITLEPCEVTSSIYIKEVGFRWLAYVDGNIIVPVKLNSSILGTTDQVQKLKRVYVIKMFTTGAEKDVLGMISSKKLLLKERNPSYLFTYPIGYTFP